jgi:tight adherence protein B
VAFVLVRLEQNRQAFETELGAVVLLFGLLLSIVAYAVVNKLGNLTLPGRIFNAAS